MIHRFIGPALAGALLAAPALGQVAGDRLAPLAPIQSEVRRFDGQTVTVTARPNQPASPDVFGTAALDAGVTVYGARWRRVSAADEKDPRLAAMMAPAAGLDQAAKLAFVQSAVSRRIVWRRDLDGYRISDYWAQAGETLDRGYGDGEDIAVLKMQALKVAGFSPRDIYLSVGRDSVRGADTRLLVRVDGRFFALDDRAESPQPADRASGFIPVITLGKNIAWLHGKRYAGRGSTAKARAVTAGAPISR